MPTGGRRRRLIFVSAALTMLLAVLWLATVWKEVFWSRGDWHINIGNGGVTVAKWAHGTTVIYDVRPARPGKKQTRSLLPPRSGPMRWLPIHTSDPITELVFVPFWMPASVTATLWGWSWYRRWKAGRAVSSCAACGYSLAGLKDDRCPECGHRTANATRVEDSVDEP